MTFEHRLVFWSKLTVLEFLITDATEPELLDKLEDRKSEWPFSSKADVIVEIEILRSEIETHSEFIDELISIRDKVFAHSDPSQVPIELPIEKLEELSLLAIKIVNRIRGGILDREFLFDTIGDWKIDWTIRNLGSLRKGTSSEDDN